MSLSASGRISCPDDDGVAQNLRYASRLLMQRFVTCSLTCESGWMVISFAATETKKGKKKSVSIASVGKRFKTFHQYFRRLNRQKRVECSWEKVMLTILGLWSIWLYSTSVNDAIILVEFHIPCFKKHVNWLSKSAERNRELSIFVQGRDKVVTRILLWPNRVV